MRNRKSRVLKAMGFSSLALVMGAIGTLAFAPLNLAQISSASEAEMTTEQGLITPKADDPTLYTTESGLDIKFGLAMPTINASLPSGNLKGFPYFTTTSGSTTYTWVIIGRNSDVAMLSGGIMQYLYSQWKATSAISGSVAQYYFSNVDTTTPAGALIDTQASSKAYVYDKGIDSSITVNDTEIPSGCVLCLSNEVTSGSIAWSTGHWDNAYAQIALTQSKVKNAVRATCEDYYTNDSFGFDSNLSLIQSVSLSQYGYYWNGSYSVATQATINQYFFPLGNNTSYDNFRWQTYLTADQVKTSYNVWSRTSTSLSGAHYITTSGGTGTNGSYQSYGYVRPACVIKLA